MIYKEIKKEEASDWAENNFGHWKKKYINRYQKESLSIGVLTPIQCYCGGCMCRVNELLRTGNISFGNEKSFQAFKESLDADFKTAPKIPENILVYRLVDEDEFNSILQKVSYVDKGFLSTSLDGQLSLNSSSTLNYIDKAYLLRIKVDKGSRALYTSFFDCCIDEEYELLFPRNCKLQVEGSLYMDNNLNKNVLDCKLIPPSE